TNYIFHAINIVLVFFFIKELSGNEKVSLLTALLFAIHPMGVQSVGWISERKNVLYTVFFLLSLIQYIKYLKFQKCKAYVFAWIFFVLSVTAKWAAYPLPVVLLLLDWFYDRKFSAKLIAEKLPYFAVPVI